MNNFNIRNLYALFAISLKRGQKAGYLTLVWLTCFISFSQHANQAPESFNQCVVCHGDQAQGNKALKSPSLAGLDSDYLTRQLMSFRTGVRGTHKEDTLGAQMTAISQQLDVEKELPALVSFISSLPAQAANDDSTKASGDLKNGSRYYQAKCGACHSGQAEGNPSFKAPKLAGQDSDYLKRQIINFQTGVRGTHPDDKLGRQMAMMSKMVKGKELDDILHYISQQSAAKK